MLAAYFVHEHLKGKRAVELSKNTLSSWEIGHPNQDIYTDTNQV